MVYIGESRVSWLKTLFTMLPKDVRAKQTTDFRPIANLRLLYKTFAYFLLGRLEHVLDANQPEEQHGFRARRRRLEEHLLSAMLPIWFSGVEHQLSSGTWTIFYPKLFHKYSYPTSHELRHPAINQHGCSRHLPPAILGGMRRLLGTFLPRFPSIMGALLGLA